MNLFRKDLPPFDGLAVQAKYTIMHRLKHTEEELSAWRIVEALIDEFKSANKYVLAVPMWNFSIPYRLKQYIDILVQPTYTFNVTDAEAMPDWSPGSRCLLPVQAAENILPALLLKLLIFRQNT